MAYRAGRPTRGTHVKAKHVVGRALPKERREGARNGYIICTTIVNLTELNPVAACCRSDPTSRFSSLASNRGWNPNNRHDEPETGTQEHPFLLRTGCCSPPRNSVNVHDVKLHDSAVGGSV